jgi:hypothetical protein
MTCGTISPAGRAAGAAAIMRAAGLTAAGRSEGRTGSAAPSRCFSKLKQFRAVARADAAARIAAAEADRDAAISQARAQAGSVRPLKRCRQARGRPARSLVTSSA